MTVTTLRPQEADDVVDLPQMRGGHVARALRTRRSTASMLAGSAIMRFISAVIGDSTATATSDKAPLKVENCAPANSCTTASSDLSVRAA